ncbi:MAG: galactose mutarotase [Melioribacteraceae bacterium]|nr:galactose mutarotase [Melioribacteraceae bacterium]
MNRVILIIILIAFVNVSSLICKTNKMEDAQKMSITKQFYGKTPDGENVDLFTLTNANGLQATIINYGATVTTLKTPDRDGNFADIVLGYDNLDGYINDPYYFGTTAGRFAGRVANGKFSIDGKEYQLSINNGANHLHGGIKGFNRVVWDASIKETDEGLVLELTYLSKDGEEGYPGNLSTTVTYSLNNENELTISYKAETDKPTIVNLTHHSYFNLSGYNSGDILDHELTIFADFYAPAETDWLVPTGEVRAVKSTVLDFTIPRRIGDRIKDAPAAFGGNNGGYDLNYALKNQGRLEIAARVYEPKSGRVMETYTSEPALQVYTSNFISGGVVGKGVDYQKYAGLCLEPEHFPDTPNKPHLPSSVLRPGETYQHTIIYKFLNR